LKNLPAVNLVNELITYNLTKRDHMAVDDVVSLQRVVQGDGVVGGR
jgi:hypothetical protein